MTDEPEDTTDESTQNQAGSSDARSEEDTVAIEQPTDSTEAADDAEQAAETAKKAAETAKKAAQNAEQPEPSLSENAGVQHVEVEASEQPAHIDQLEVKKEIVEGATSDTTSTRTRHWLTNDIIAGILHISLVLLVLGDAFGTIDLGVIPPRIRLLYIGVVASAAIWTFGQGVLEAVRA